MRGVLGLAGLLVLAGGPASYSAVYPVTVLDKSVPVRSMALSEAGAAIEGDATLLLANPAATARVRGAAVTVEGRRGLADDYSAGILSTVDAWGNRVSAGFLWFDTGKASIGVESGVAAVTVQRDFMGCAGYAKPLGEYVSLGVTGKYLRTTYFEETTGDALLGDAGVQVAPFDWLSAGLALRNAGTGLRFEYVEYDLPVQVDAGAALSAVLERPGGGGSDRFTVLGDVMRDVHGGEMYYRAGCEYAWLDIAALRGGVRLDDSKLIWRYTIGLGIRRKGLRIDYGYIMSESGNNPQALSSTISF